LIGRGGGGAGDPVIGTSEDIDFWGGRSELTSLAKALGKKAIFPNQYEISVWTGAIPLSIHGKKSAVGFLHVVPGLDTIDPERAGVAQKGRAERGSRISFLTGS
jgi:hypothetical protein